MTKTKLITATSQGKQLSNNKLQVFKPDIQQKSDTTLQLGNIAVLCRKEDGYINATSLCKAGKKKFKHWSENKNTKAYLEELSDAVGIPTASLIKYKSGRGNEQATWVHRKVAIHIAQWISPRFAVRVTSWIEEYKDKTNKSKVSFPIIDSSLVLKPGYEIKYRKEDGYINVTSLCKAGGKQFKHWKSIQKTKAFLQVLSRSVGIPTDLLIKVERGGLNENRKTWVYPQVAINIAQWISPEFDVKVSTWMGKHKDGDVKNNKSLILAGDCIFNCQLTLKDGKTIKIPMREDGYINITALCKANGKNYWKWKENKNSLKVIDALERSLRIRRDLLIQTVSGGINKNRGTWVHRRLGIIIAQWISPNVAVQVATWIEELGKDTLPQNEGNEILDCKLTLSDKKVISIPMRKDGYVNLTLLCKAGGKQLKNWYQNKQTKALIRALECEAGIPASQLIEVKRGNSSKFKQGSWGHPDLAIQCAQWVSPSFAIQVSRWTRELLITGSVTLGQEKSNRELEEQFQKKIALLEQQNFALQKKHNALVRRHFYYKFKQKGPSLYIITSGLEYKDGVTRIKFGICGCPKRKISTCPHCKKNLEDGKDNDSIDNRLSTHRTLWPRLLVKFLVYTPDARLLEKCLKRVYRNQINPSGHEIVEGVTVSEIIDRTKRYLEMFNVFNDDPDYAVEKNVNKYNQRTLEIMKDSSSEKKNLMLDHLSQISLDGSEELEQELEEESGQESGEGSEGESDMFIVESESEEEESEDEEEARLEEARLEEERRRKEATKEEQAKREFDAKQKEYFEGLLRDLKTYTDKRLKELLREWRLPLSGLKAKKKERVEGYLRKKLNIEGKKIVCQNCREEKNVGSDNFRLTERKLYSRVCLVCEVKKTKTTYLYRTDVYTTVKPGEKTKKCTKCKKMLSFNDFHNNRSRKDGKEYQCKNCSSKRKAKSGKVILEKKRPSVPDGCKWCPKCEVTKSRDAFRNASRRKDGLQGMCRNCDNETRKRNRLKKKLQR